jgi:hypothetical protein
MSNEDPTEAFRATVHASNHIHPTAVLHPVHWLCEKLNDIPVSRFPCSRPPARMQQTAPTAHDIFPGGALLSLALFQLSFKNEMHPFITAVEDKLQTTRWLIPLYSDWPLPSDFAQMDEGVKAVRDALATCYNLLNGDHDIYANREGEDIRLVWEHSGGGALKVFVDARFEVLKKLRELRYICK